MNNLKHLAKDLLFLIIFVILLNIASNVLIQKGNGYGSDVISFYKIKENSLDIVFFGSSHSYATFSPEIIEKETGLKSYNFATQQQPIYITYYYMKETLKRQNPKYFVLEARMLAVDEDYAKEGVVRDALDRMPFSINKIKAINTSVENENDRISYYFNIIKYHSRYNELNFKEIKRGILNEGLSNQGFIGLPSTEDLFVDNSEILKINEKQEINAKNLEYLSKILELTNENNIKLIVVKSPCSLTEKDQTSYNWLEEYLSNKNITFINYNKLMDDIKLEKGDFYDSGHLSKSGAIKVSEYFANDIKVIEEVV